MWDDSIAAGREIRTRVKNGAIELVIFYFSASLSSYLFTQD